MKCSSYLEHYLYCLVSYNLYNYVINRFKQEK